MIPYQRFVDDVQAKAAMSSPEEARDAAVGVVQTLVEHLDGLDRAQLAAALPPAIREPVSWNRTGAPIAESEPFVHEVAGRVQRPPEQARYVLEAVLSEVADSDRAVGDELAHRLPGEVSALIGAPDGGPPPQRSAAPAQGRPRPLDSDEVQRALSGLTNWTGDVRGLQREAHLPPENWSAVHQRIQRDQQELSHHASIEERGNGVVVFTARTRSLDSVTELDIQLARRIDAAIDEVGFEGAPTG
jgi:uncharacterized protein (DUF2267 family)/pterin-4a-carbinolamine dehydratase